MEQPGSLTALQNLDLTPSLVHDGKPALSWFGACMILTCSCLAFSTSAFHSSKGSGYTSRGLLLQPSAEPSPKTSIKKRKKDPKKEVERRLEETGHVNCFLPGYKQLQKLDSTHVPC